ncbi:hypothetical protein FCV25MIE_13840 [Fagus crenata]
MTFGSKNQLLDHAMNAHGALKVECECCGNRFSCETAREQHFNEAHSSDDAYKLRIHTLSEAGDIDLLEKRLMVRIQQILVGNHRLLLDSRMQYFTYNLE